MIIIVPEGGPRSDDPGLHWPFELEHRRQKLMPGSHVDERLTRPGERHLYAMELTRESLITAGVDTDDLELWLLGAQHAPLLGPSGLLQAVLEPGVYWLQVRRRPPSSRVGGAYRLRLHCVAL